MIYKSRALEFAFRKPEFNTIYYTYSNKSPSKYYISVLGGGGPEAMLILLIQGGGQNLVKPAYIILERSLNCIEVFHQTDLHQIKVKENKL